MTTNKANRLEYLRRELRAERISYGELAELQSLKDFIDPSDVELLEAAGVPETTNASICRKPRRVSPEVSAARRARMIAMNRQPISPQESARRRAVMVALNKARANARKDQQR